MPSNTAGSDDNGAEQVPAAAAAKKCQESIASNKSTVAGKDLDRTL